MTTAKGILEKVKQIQEQAGLYSCDYELIEKLVDEIESDLARRDQAIWDAARECGVYDVHGVDMQVHIYPKLADYEASKKDGEG